MAEKIALVKEQLPAEAGTPTIGPQSSILGELMFVALTADSTSLRDLRTIADWQIRPRLLATGGVAFITALCASTLVALTLTPVLCSYLLGKGHKDKEVREPFLARF